MYTYVKIDALVPDYLKHAPREYAQYMYYSM